MMNRLVFLGTAGDAETVLKQHRASGGVILTLNGNQFHLDPGPGSLGCARDAGVNPRDTIGVIATNNGLFHSNDVNATISAMTYEGMDRHGVLLASRSVIEGLPNDTPRVYPFYKACVEGLVPLTVGNRVGVNEIEFVPVRAMAHDPTAVGLRIATTKLTIGYTGLTGLFDGIGDLYAGCDILVVHCRHPASTIEEGALNIDGAQRLIGLVKPKKAFLTGFGSKLVAQDLTSVARDVQRATGVQVAAGKDGLEVDLSHTKHA